MEETTTTTTTCSNPGCNQPGTSKCSACKTTPYCGPICQTADWVHHKEECPGHLLKAGTAHLEKASGFDKSHNFLQALRYANLALTKLQQLKDRSLATIEILDAALEVKFNALNFMDRNKEALECATERYNMWATTNMRNPKTINVAFPLIQSLIANEQYEKAELIARTVYEQTTHPLTNDIPENLRQSYLAKASKYFAQATLSLAQVGGIPLEEKQKVGVEVIALARKALEIHIQMLGTEDFKVAGDMVTLANALEFFSNNDDDDEIPRLFKQSTIIYRKTQGSSSVNVAVGENNLGRTFNNRAKRALDAHDLDRCLANGELALPHFREAVRIYRAVNYTEKANGAELAANRVEEGIRLARIQIAAAIAATKG